jgi:hypothetical protein
MVLLKDYVAYCFAEVKGFSKFGSYTGNGSADGTFVYTGFKPAFLMIKNSLVQLQQIGMYDNRQEADQLSGVYVNNINILPNTNGAGS